jgi:phosphatidate cytidylyltransferase
VTRVLSALALIPIVLGTIWFLPPAGTFVLAAIAAVLAFGEYRTIARALGANVSAVIGGTAVVLVCFAMWIDDSVTTNWHGELSPYPNVVYLAMMASLVVAGAVAISQARPGPSTLADTAATVFAPVYLGLPLGALAALRGDLGAEGTRSYLTSDTTDGRLVVLLLMLVIVVSDSAQYYTGRAFGRRQLSPAISPKKTVEGAIGGVVFGTLAMAVGGSVVFETPVWILALLGAVISLLGIVGDLFESLLKRSAGVKDSSNLIPGHGGVLDRIDSWLFAAPIYYVFVRFVA